MQDFLCLITEIRSCAFNLRGPVRYKHVSASLPVSRLQAKYKGRLGKRDYQKKRKAGMGSGIKGSLLRAMFSGRSSSLEVISLYFG